MRLRGKPEAFVRITDAERQQDAEMLDAPAELTQERSGSCFVIAIDFGTTFSSVAFRRTDDVDRKLKLEPRHISCVERFPYNPSGSSKEEVPTTSWYLGRPRQGHNDKAVNSNDDSSIADHVDIDDDRPDQDAMFALPSDDSDDEDAQVHQDVYLWGYSVHRKLGPYETDLDHKLRIARSKLILDDSALTADIREELRDSIKILKEKRHIRKDTDIIIDFLTGLLQHTKSYLMQYHNLDDNMPVEFVVCVPVAWKRPAYRTMQTALTQAVKRAAYSDSSISTIQNMFMVSEPEAAAACVLSEPNNIEAGEAFLLLDAGGGTVDATTFIVEKDDPLRLKREGVEPDAELCGSSFLNKYYEDLLYAKLQGEKDALEKDGVTLHGIINDCVQDFENLIKRNYDVMAKEKPLLVFIPGLRNDPEKDFILQYLRIGRTEMKELFMKCLKPIAEMMQRQIELAKQNRLEVEKVVLIGGFAGSPSLQKYLKFVLDQMEKRDGLRKRLMTPAVPGTAVAQGAVLRALRKEDGPDRIAKSSYGCLRTEPYHGDPDMKEAHDSMTPEEDPFDGDEYIKDTIDWFIRKEDLVPSEQIYTFRVIHTFPLNRPKLICKESLFVADDRLESHYKRKDKRNRGARVAGSIVVDMTFLKTRGHMGPTIPDAGKPGRPHYKVEFDLVIKVSGRSLRFEASWPGGDHGTVIQADQICIAAAFESGTS